MESVQIFAFAGLLWWICWGLYTGSFGDFCFVLFFVSKSAAMLARSLPVLGGKMLVHDVAYASTTYAELVHSVIQTYCQAQSDST